MNGLLGCYIAGTLDGIALGYLIAALIYRRNVRRTANQAARQIQGMGK
ncbi:hypothetical protein GCM10009804_03040 [Kribbella hippodromi]|uniref:Uncharacterized protein n=1 Tax=Kribbella hippodromi TaxID=434347 RepID=A0ABN2BZW3_9ACTN